METLLQDIRYAARALVRRPGFAAVVVLALALSIGATVALFSVLDAVVLQPLPYPEADRLVQVWSENRFHEIEESLVSYGDLLYWQEESELLELMGAYDIVGYNLWGGEQPERIDTGIGSYQYFQALGAKPILGRLFGPEDEVWGNHRVGLISHGLWQRRYGSDPEVVGKAITIDGFDYTIVGVLGPDFIQPVPGSTQQPDLWRAMGFPPTGVVHDHRALPVIARLKPGVSLEQAQEEMSSIARQLEELHPDTNTHWGARVVSLQRKAVGNFRGTLLTLLGAVACVLLIGCVNVANLMLSRSHARTKEISVRRAFGAGRGRLIRLLLTESLMLALAGGALGLVLAYWGLAAVTRSYGEIIPRVQEIDLDFRMLGFTLLASVTTAVFFGLVPALVATTRERMNPALRQAGSLAATPWRRGLSYSLVLAEVALAVVPLIGAGLLVLSFKNLQETDSGFESESILTMQMAMPWIKYHREGTEGAQVRFFDQLLPQLETLPGVRSAAAAVPLPVNDEFTEPSDFYVEGRPLPAPGEASTAEIVTISPRYLETMGMSLIRGRAFTDQDRDGTPDVAIVNRQMADLYFPGEDPIGQRISLVRPEGPSEPVDPEQEAAAIEWIEIVGLLANARYASVDAEPVPQMYVPLAQDSFWTINLALRAEGDPTRLAAAVREEVLKIDPDQPVYDIKTMERIVSDSLLRQRFSLSMFTVFAVVALVLASIGVYGVMSYAVAQRTQEIGLRLGLGARRLDVFRLLVRQGMIWVIMGLALGLALALGTARLMSSQLYGVGASDLSVFATAFLVMAGVGLVANLIPAVRATRVDPNIALRYE